AERLAKDGFSIVVHYAGNRAKAEETVKRIEAAGGKATAVGADISKATEVAQRILAHKAECWSITPIHRCKRSRYLIHKAVSHSHCLQAQQSSSTRIQAIR